MHVSREDMHIHVSSLLKCKMHLHLRDSVGWHLHYATVEFEVQIYICIAPVGDSLTGLSLLRVPQQSEWSGPPCAYTMAQHLVNGYV
jgi:hypothetical protein